MNELQIINEQEVLGKAFRIYGTVEEPLFMAKDVAEWIEYDSSSVNKMLTSVDEDEKVRKIVPTLGGNQEAWLLTENGLYEVLMQSRKPIAKQFKSKVKEILKSIRKTGSYGVPRTTAGQIQLLAMGHMELEQKIDDVNKDLQDFKQEMPLLAVECQQITDAKNHRVVSLMGGKGSNAYRNASLRGKVYRDLESQLRREFEVTSYKAIRRNQTNLAIEIINSYTLPHCLTEQITFENAQFCME